MTGERATLRTPPWVKRPVPRGEQVRRVRSTVRRWRLHTVCESAACPNRQECYSQNKLTFMVLGDRCTRNCAFCAVQTGRPFPPDPDEPDRLSQAASELGLAYVVITSVCRDDLPDGGASHFAATIRALRVRDSHVRAEVLIPDFRGSPAALEQVIDAAPTVLNHNVETVPRLYPVVRPQGSYNWSLELLGRAKTLQPDLPIKSGLILGLGEQRDEVVAVLNDLRDAGCDIVTLGQYLRPSLTHRPVDRYVTPGEFAEYEEIGRQMGFRAVASGPLVRSSFMAEEIASNL